MVSDQLTFFLSFAVVFGALGWYLLHLEREVDGLRERLCDAASHPVEAARDEGGGGPGPDDDDRMPADDDAAPHDPDAANAKNRDREDRS